MDRVKSVDNLGTPGAARVVLSVGYDADSNRTSLAAALGGSAGVAGTADFANAYAFDALDRLTQVTQSGAAAAGVADKGAAFGYDDVGRLRQIDRYADASADLSTSGVAPLATSVYDYDHDNRLKDLSQYGGGGLIMADYTWGYDDAARVRHFTGPGGEDVTYGYDDDDQLKSATSADTSVRADESYQYDPNGNRTAANANAGYHTIADNRMDADGTYAYLKRRC
jgi:YD repeat-containing protein